MLVMLGRPRIRVVYYTQSAFLACLPGAIQGLAPHAELHVIVEVTPKTWPGNCLDLPAPTSAVGLTNAAAMIQRCIPAGAWNLMKDCETITYATFPQGPRLQGLQVIGALARLIRRIGPDLVHFDGETPRAALLAGLIRVPVVLAVHEPRLPAGDSRSSARIAKYGLMRRANALVSHSEFVSSELGKMTHLGAPVYLARLPVMTVFVHYGDELLQRVDPPLVLSWGWLTPRKGLDTLLAAAPLIAEQAPGVRFLIAGRPGGGYSNPSTPRLPNGASLSIQPRYLAAAELADLLRTATLVAMPYRTATQSAMLLTAYAFNKPCVVSEVGGLREQVVDGVTGLLCRPNDPKSFAANCLRAIGSQELQARLARGISEYSARHLSYEVFGEALAAAYRGVLRVV